MATTVLGAIQNAWYNLNTWKDTGHGLEQAMQQLRNGTVLLEKGYNPYDEIDDLLRQHGDVNNVPEAPEEGIKPNDYSITSQYRFGAIVWVIHKSKAIKGEVVAVRGEKGVHGYSYTNIELKLKFSFGNGLASEEWFNEDVCFGSKEELIASLG